MAHNGKGGRIMNEKLVKASPAINAVASLIMIGAAVVLVTHTKRLARFKKKRTATSKNVGK